MAHTNLYLKAYTQHKSNAKTRGVEFLFTFEQWRDWWIATGKWEQRGRGRGKYCMRRHGDIGPYSIDNVFCGTNEDNVRDGNVGKVDSLVTRLKKSEALIGKPKPWAVGDRNPMHRPEVKAKMSAAIGGANHYNAIGVTTPQGFFPTAKAAAAALGMKKPTVEWRARHNKFGFSYGNHLAIA
jgi:hypothetical protein